MSWTTISTHDMQSNVDASASLRHSAKSFTRSLLLLSVALLAALFSNTSARNGETAAAMLGAVLALGVALWVSWRFVPRLAAAVEWEWAPLLSQLTVTREGWFAFASVAIVGAAAINTSNNLLYMIFSALIALLVLSVFLAGVNFRSLTLEARIPAECIVRESFPMTLTVRNGKRVFPSFSILTSSGEHSPFRFSATYFPMVGARDRESIVLQTACSRRGHHVLDRVNLHTRYPFGFLIKGGSFPVSGACIAFPEIRDVRLPDRWTPDLIGSSEHLERGQGTDLYMIRDYQTTDSARRVDWKASAKTSVLKTREFTREETRRVVLLFDRYGRPEDETRFEDLVSEAASVASRLVDKDVEVGLVTDDWTSGFGSTDQTLRSVLRYLALVSMAPGAGRPRNPYGGETFSLSLR